MQANLWAVYVVVVVVVLELSLITNTSKFGKDRDDIAKSGTLLTNWK